MTTATVPTAPPTSPPPTAPAAHHRSGGPSLTKLTVNITPRAVAALEDAVETNRESKTDAVNRALQAYAFLTRMMDSGWELVLKDAAGREKLVQFL